MNCIKYKRGENKVGTEQFRPGGKNYVYVNDQRILKIDQAYIENLKNEARKSKYPRLTMCLHNDIRNNVHEMIQIFRKYEYVQPHYHPKKTETKIILEGRMLVVIYDTSGNKLDQFVMSRDEGSAFMFRMDKGIIHTNIPLTDVVFQEITSGPYLGKDDSIFPDWTCHSDDTEGVQRYIDDLLRENGNIGGF